MAYCKTPDANDDLDLVGVTPETVAEWLLLNEEYQRQQAAAE